MKQWQGNLAGAPKVALVSLNPASGVAKWASKSVSGGAGSSSRGKAAGRGNAAKSDASKPVG